MATSRWFSKVLQIRMTDGGGERMEGSGQQQAPKFLCSRCLVGSYSQSPILRGHESAQAGAREQVRGCFPLVAPFRSSEIGVNDSTGQVVALPTGRCGKLTHPHRKCPRPAARGIGRERNRPKRANVQRAVRFRSKRETCKARGEWGAGACSGPTLT